MIREEAPLERVIGQADLLESYRIGAMVATDNSAFEVRRPSGIGPGSCHEQVGNRTALDRPM